MRKMRAIMELVEGRAAIFHGTSIPALLDILHDGRLRADLGMDEHAMGVSFSEDAGVASRFAPQAEDFFWHKEYPLPDGVGQAEHDKTQPQGAVLEFDRAAVEDRTTLRRVRWDGVGTERELRALSDVPLTWGLVAIRVRAEDLMAYRRLSVVHPDVFTEPQMAGLPALLSHPLLRPL